MKRTMIFILLILVILCILAVLYFIFSSSSNGKLTLNEIARLFKPTQFLDYQININDVEEVEIIGPIDLQNTDETNYIYTNKEKIQIIVDYLNSIPLVETKRDELPNMSPDVTIQFNGADQKQIGSIWIYGQVYIEDQLSGNLYRCKKSNQIIEEIETLDLNFID